MPKSGPRKKNYNLGGGERLFDIEVPSGALCQARRPGIPGLVKIGVLDSLDQLTTIVKQEHLDQAQSGGKINLSKEDLASFGADSKRLAESLAVIDKVVCAIVVQPRVVRPVVLDKREAADPETSDKTETYERPMTQDEQDLYMEDPSHAGHVWTEDIDFEDKIFLFQWAVGGVSDLAQFRAEFGEAMGGVASLSGVPVSAEPDLPSAG